MGFERSDHIKGKIFKPVTAPGHFKKHACNDCFSCQMCSDDRCGLCRGEKGDDGTIRPDKKPSS